MAACECQRYLFKWIPWIFLCFDIVHANIDISISPQEVIVPPDYVGQIILQCNVNDTSDTWTVKNTTLKIHWSKGGVPILERWRENINTEKTPVFILDDDSLFIGPLKPEREGLYACTVQLRYNGDLLAENRSTAPVYFAKIEEFFLVPSDIDREEGDSAILTCVSGWSIPQANVTWMKSGQFALRGEQSQYIMKHDEDTGMYKTSSILRFENLTLEDHGDYSCVAVNSLVPSQTKVSENVLLKVVAKPSQPTIIKHPTSVYAVRGKPSTFTCVAIGNPQPEFNWYYNSVEIDQDAIENSTEVTIETYGQTSVLTITVSEEATTGEYACAVKNEFGRSVSHTAELQIASFTWSFEQEPQDHESIKGDAVTLLCRPPESHPPAIVSWYKDNHLLNISKYPSVQQLPTGDLYIGDIKLKHDGSFFCKAYNWKLDSTASSRRAKLTVYAPPTISPLPSTKDVSIERTVKLECNVTGAPFPEVSWKRNYRPLVPTDRIILGLRNQTLFITAAERTDEGFYSCLATNRLGNSSAGPTLLKVNVPPVIYSVVPDDILLELTLPYTIPCIASGVPEPKYNWTMDGVPLNISTDPRFTLVSDGLKISRVREDDAGQYNCTAYNKAGTYWSEGIIRVKVPAQFTEVPHDVAADEFSDANFTCEGRGYPEVFFEWTVQEEKGDTENDNPPEYIISYGNNGTVITFENITRDMQGLVVTCNIRNFWSSNNKSASLTVNTEPVVLEINISHSSPISPGTRLTLNCLTEGRPPPKISWLHHSLITGETTEVGVKGRRLLVSKSGKLIVTSTEEFDEGTFTCIAENSVGTTSDDLSITVLDPPAPPIHVTLETISSRTIRARWSSPDFEQNLVRSYKIQYEDVDNPIKNYNVTSVMANKGINEALLSSLNPASEYSLKIASMNDAGTSDWSLKLKITTFPDSPSVPTMISLHHVTSSSFEISWKMPTETNGIIADYKVGYRKIAPGSYFPLNELTFTASDKGLENATIADLEPYSDYIVMVKAGTLGLEGEILWGDYSLPMRVETSEAVPSVAPNNVQVIVTSSTSLDVSWMQIPEESRHGSLIEYRIQLLDVLLNKEREVIVNASETSTTINELSPWRKYALKIAAATSVGHGPWSESIETRTFSSAPSVAPSNFTTLNIQNDSVTLSWDEVEEWRQNGPGSFYTFQIWETGHNTTAKKYSYLYDEKIVVPDLSPWTNYSAKIRVNNEPNGPGPWSMDLNFQTEEAAPGPCHSFTGANLSWERVILTWKKPENMNGQPKGYWLEYQSLACSDTLYSIDFETKTCYSTEITTDPSSTTEYKTSAIVESNIQTHKQKVAQIVDSDRLHRGASSDEVKTTVIPPDIAPTDYANNMTDLTWTINSTRPVTSTPVPTLEEGPEINISVPWSSDKTSSLTVTNLNASTVYMFTIQAVNGAGMGTQSLIYVKTSPAPTTTVPTTTPKVTTEELTTPEFTTENMKPTPLPYNSKRSVIIAGSTAAALFVSIAIALVAASRCIRSKKTPPKVEDYLVPTSSIIPKNISPIFNTLSEDQFQLWGDEALRSHKYSDSSNRDQPSMETFTGRNGKNSLLRNNSDANSELSESHYRRCHSPSPDEDSDLSAVHNGTKTFTENGSIINGKGVKREPLYAKASKKSNGNINGRISRNHSKDPPSNFVPPPSFNTLSLSVDDSFSFPSPPHDLINHSSISCSDYDSTNSFSDQGHPHPRRPQVTSIPPLNIADPLFPSPPCSNIDDLVNTHEMGDSIQTPREGGYYPYGQYNTNNNKTDWVPGFVGNLNKTFQSDSLHFNDGNFGNGKVQHLRNLEVEDTYL